MRPVGPDEETDQSVSPKLAGHCFWIVLDGSHDSRLSKRVLGGSRSSRVFLSWF